MLLKHRPDDLFIYIAANILSRVNLAVRLVSTRRHYLGAMQ